MTLALLVCVLLLAVGCTRLGYLKSKHVSWAKRYIIYIALPAVALLNLPSLPRNAQIGYSILSPILVFAGAYVLFYGVLRQRYAATERVVPTILSGLGNTSFIGFPLIAALWGTEHMGYAVVYDQVGFVLMATIAQYLITKDAGESSIRNIARQLLFFPPFIALLVAVALYYWGYQSPFQPMLQLASQSLSPVAMVVVGYTLARYARAAFPNILRVGLFYKLVLAPALVLLVLWYFPTAAEVRNMCVFESAMGPMITPAILLLHRDKDPQLVAQFLFWGIALSFGTTLIWFYLLQYQFT